MGQINVKQEASTPSNPASGYDKLYPTADGWKHLDDAGVAKLIALLSSTLTNNRIVIVDASGQLDADADLTWNGSVLAVGGSNPVTGATLDVAGDIVVSDGAGGSVFTIDPTNKATINVVESVHTDTFIATGGGPAVNFDIMWPDNVSRTIDIEVTFNATLSNSGRGCAYSERFCITGYSSIVPTQQWSSHLNSYANSMTIVKSLITGGVRYAVTYTYGSGAISVKTLVKQSPSNYMNITIT